MMNSSALLELARERNRDLIDDALRSRRIGRRQDQDLPASEMIFLYGRSALAIDARARAEARLRVTGGATHRS